MHVDIAPVGSSVPPVGVIEVSLRDAPGQRRHAGMHRGREGARVDIILQQQYLRLGVFVANCAQRAHIVA